MQLANNHIFETVLSLLIYISEDLVVLGCYFNSKNNVMLLQHSSLH